MIARRLAWCSLALSLALGQARAADELTFADVIARPTSLMNATTATAWNWMAVLGLFLMVGGIAAYVMRSKRNEKGGGVCVVTVLMGALMASPAMIDLMPDLLGMASAPKVIGAETWTPGQRSVAAAATYELRPASSLMGQGGGAGSGNGTLSQSVQESVSGESGDEQRRQLTGD